MNPSDTEINFLPVRHTDPPLHEVAIHRIEPAQALLVIHIHSFAEAVEQRCATDVISGHGLPCHAAGNAFLGHPCDEIDPATIVRWSQEDCSFCDCAGLAEADAL